MTIGNGDYGVVATESERAFLGVEGARRVYHRFVSFYDAFRSVWSRWTRPIEEDLDQIFRECIRPGARILELAPGTGINIGRLLRCGSDFESYLGIDASEEMLSRARGVATGDERFELRVGDATDLDSVTGAFDFIVSTWLLSHLDSPSETVRDALGRLAPDGTAVFVFFTSPRSRLVRAGLRRLGRPLSYQLVDPEPIYRLPGFDRGKTCAGGMATLVVFRGRQCAGSA